jgi:hypothetical protein
MSSNFCTIYVLLSAQGTFSKIDHILDLKASLSKYKKTEKIPCILSDHNALKLKLNNKTTVKNMQTIRN